MEDARLLLHPSGIGKQQGGVSLQLQEVQVAYGIDDAHLVRYDDGEVGKVLPGSGVQGQDQRQLELLRTGHQSVHKTAQSRGVVDVLLAMQGTKR